MITASPAVHTPLLRRLLRLLLLFLLLPAPAPAAPPETGGLWAQENLMAWCIVPFDAKKRGPEERAVMLDRLGLRRMAYDWRAEHVPTFDAEVEAMQRHRIELTAWWFPTELNSEAKAIIRTIEKYRITPQWWVMGGGAMLPPGQAHEARVAEEAHRIAAFAREAKRLGCKVALYNHGGWFGEPENQIAVIEKLRLGQIDNVGIVYNFHHAHEHLPRFGELVRKMKPWLLAVNLNGMIPEGDRAGKKILNLSEGSHELEMMRVLQASGWQGPVGIIDHRESTDSEETLRDNLKGMAWLRAELSQPGTGGSRPFPGASSLDSIAHEVPGPRPAPFFPDALPLDPSEHPHHREPVNRDRVYDFYAKQALRYGRQQPLPALLPAYPGLDNGRFGHWGNQNEEIWQDARWNDMDAGGMQSGVVTMGKVMIPRAVCVQLGEPGEMAACFDSDTLTWEGFWKGGEFLRFDPFRWGMLGGLTPAGTVTKPSPVRTVEKGDFAYHGFYRHGSRIIFSYRLHDIEWLESAAVEQGEFTIHRQQRGGTLEALTKGGPPQWPQILESTLDPGGGTPYAIDTFRLPATPWKSLWHIGGHDFLPNGDAVLCTFEGEIWVVSGIDDATNRLRWKRFASGLAQPLGLKVMDGRICVLGRDQVTRLHDLNADGEADYYEAFSRAWESPVGGHDYLTGLESDDQSRLYFASGKLGISRLSADGKSREVLATGFRNPNGLAVGPYGEVIAAAQEGDWAAASFLAEIIPGGHYRHGGPKSGPLGDLPATLYFPRGVDNSCGGQVFVDSDRWGIPRGHLLHFSWGTGSAFHILREEQGGVRQGCAVPLPGEFRSGAHRGRFRSRDGQLYVSGMTGWGTYTPEAGCFQRMRYTGGTVTTLTAVQAHGNGLLLSFAAPLDPAAVAPALYFAQQWNYRMGPAYGSDEYSVRWPESPGHDVLEVKAAHLLGGGGRLFLEIPQLRPCHQLHLHCGVGTLLSQDFFLTLHQLGADFSGFPGYQPVAKIKTEELASVPEVPIDASPWEHGTPGRPLLIQTAPALQFAQKELRVHAAESLSLTLENPDVMPHNWVLAKPGTDQAVAERADQMVADPEGYRRSYVPGGTEVLCFTRLVGAGQSGTIHFTAPSEPGRYPYLCTFPGHTKIMRGVLIVE